MSLIAWWPLTGHTNNYGILRNEIEATATNVTYAEGKIGQALYKGTLTLTGEQWKKIIGNTISIAMWIYTRDDGTYSAGTPFFGMSGMTAPNNRKFSMFHYNTKTNLHCSWQNDDSDSTYWSCHYSNFFELNTWVHLCVVQDAAKNTITVYRNGEQYSKSTVTGLSSMNFKEAGTAPIRANIDYQHINDIRIYNHALTIKEIKELNKAVVCHYNFDNPYSEGTVNIDPCKNAMTTKTLNGSFSATTVTFGNYYGYDCFELYLKKDSITSWTGCYLNSNPLQLGAVIGDTVTRSCWMYVPSGQTIPGHFTESIEGNSSNKKYVQYNLNNCDTWQRVSLTGTITDDGTNNYLHYFMAMSSGSVNFKCYIRDFQMEINDHSTPYTPTLRNETLYNTTALIQPSYLNNIKIIQDDAKIGTQYLQCVGNTMINTPLTGDITKGATISCWVKTPTYPETNSIVFADYNSKLAFGFYGTQNAIISCGSYSAPYISNIKSKWLDGWNHVVVTRNASGTIACYLNGQLQTTSGSNNWTSSTGYSTIGGRYNGSYTTYFTGYVDDFRIYHSLLSNEDIQELYHTRWASNPQGQVFSNGVNEGQVNFQITSSGVNSCNMVSELSDTFELIDYVEATSNRIIDTGIPFNPNVDGVEFKYSANTAQANYFIAGCGSSGLTKPYLWLYHYTGVNGFNVYVTDTSNAQIAITGYRGMDTNTHVIKYDSKILYCDGIQTGSTSKTLYDSMGNLKLFNTATNNTTYATRGKIYYCKIWKNGELVGDFIPAKRLRDNVTGFLDTITKKFITDNTIDMPISTVRHTRNGSLCCTEFNEV